MIDVVGLLGRPPIQAEVDLGYLKGRKVLVTGAGGSIGSELCRSIHRCDPEMLIMLDRDESALHQARLSIYGDPLFDDPSVVLADLRDTISIYNTMDEYRPDVVFHAAALKHQRLLQRYPAEAIKTNIRGTATVLYAAIMSNVETLVNISTDKATRPTCALGASKLVGERMTAWFSPRRYVSVRFGNVLGSRGSMLDTWTAQIAAGVPLTVAAPDVTRYFMTPQEASQLVLAGGAIGQSGETLVLDMGDPIKIVDLARRFAGPKAKIVYTGLGEAEKSHESRLGEAEKDFRPVNKLITHVKVPPLDPQTAMSIDVGGARHEVAERLLTLANRIAIGAAP